MKFGKLLRERVQESYPEWRPKFMNYKALKQAIYPPASTANGFGNGVNHSRRQSHSESLSHDSDNVADIAMLQGRAVPPIPPAPSQEQATEYINTIQRAEASHAQFFCVFRGEVDKVNDFFLDKQEDFVMEHAQFSQRVNSALIPGRFSTSQLYHLRQRLTDFHGQLVLLDSFSTINFIGFRKILKKFDKKTQLNVHKFYMSTVLSTPFFTTPTVRNKIGEVENQLHQLEDFHETYFAPSLSSSMDVISFEPPRAVEMQHFSPSPSPSPPSF